jgi:hypothetical protein
VLSDILAASTSAGLSGSALSPEGAFLSLVLAAAVDTWAIGGPRLAPLFDRLAFVGWVACWQVGFQGAGLTGRISGIVTGAFTLLAGVWDYPLFVGAVHIGPQILALVVLAITIGAMAPTKVKFLGKLSNIQFEHLRQAGTAAMARTGMGAGAPGVAPRASSGLIRKIFPGSINIGMVALALLFVTSATVVTGGFGSAATWGVAQCIAVCSAITRPLLMPLGYA